MTDALLSSRDGDLLVMRMNRADKKNALTGAMYSALTEGLRAAAADDAVGAIVILGSPGAFCAGNDIKDFIGFAMNGALGTPILDFLHALVGTGKPLIAGVDGVAVGIGTTMLLHCDHVIASDRSSFATPFVDLGLVPEAASSLLLPQIMGHRHAYEWLVMGARFDAARAAACGLVNRVVSVEALESETLASARAIAAKPREAAAIAKRLMRPDPALLLARIDEEAKLFAERLRSAEARRAFEAFLAKPKG